MLNSNLFPLPDKPVLCNKCGKIFITQDSLKTHNEMFHQKVNEKKSDLKNNKEKESQVQIDNNIIHSKNDGEDLGHAKTAPKRLIKDVNEDKPNKPTAQSQVLGSGQTHFVQSELGNTIVDNQDDPWTTMLLNVRKFFINQYKNSKFIIAKEKKFSGKPPKKIKLSKMEIYKSKLKEKREARTTMIEEKKLLRMKQIYDNNQEKNHKILERKKAHILKMERARDEKQRKRDEEKQIKQKYIDDKRKERMVLLKQSKAIEQNKQQKTKKTKAKKAQKSYPRVPQNRQDAIQNVVLKKPRQYGNNLKDYFRDQRIKTKDENMKEIKDAHWIQSSVHEILTNEIYTSNKQKQVLQELYGGNESEKEFNCKKCSKRFSSVHGLQSHFKINHEKRLAKKCAQCNIIFDNPTLQRAHYKEVHPRQIMESKCTSCDKCFSNPKTLTKHKEAVHEGVVNQCKFCDKTFSFPENMRRHMRQVHTDLKPFGCNHCDTFFGDSGNLKRHIRMVHLKIKIPCQICEKLCLDSTDLARHITEKHSQPLMCKECDVDFQSIDGLKGHTNKFHSKTPTEYPCSKCELTFLSATDRYGHRVKLHREQKEAEFFKCRYCHKKFNTPADRKKHVVSHPQAEFKFPCEYCGVRRQSRIRLNLHQKQCTKAIHNTPVEMNCQENQKSYTTGTNIE